MPRGGGTRRLCNHRRSTQTERPTSWVCAMRCRHGMKPPTARSLQALPIVASWPSAVPIPVWNDPTRKHARLHTRAGTHPPFFAMRRCCKSCWMRACLLPALFPLLPLPLPVLLSALPLLLPLLLLLLPAARRCSSRVRMRRSRSADMTATLDQRSAHDHALACSPPLPFWGHRTPPVALGHFQRLCGHSERAPSPTESAESTLPRCPVLCSTAHSAQP